MIDSQCAYFAQLEASLKLRNYNAQVGETYAVIKPLNKLTEIGMPETQYIAQNTHDLASIRSYAELGNKACIVYQYLE